jgi:hypothetical protein
VTARSKDFARLGSTLRRVRVAERATPDGGKKVWHQGEGGAEVISFVDPDGRVTRQELYLDDRVAVWRPSAPISSGRLARADSATDAEAVLPDATLHVPTLHDAVALLDGYQGDDKYLAHLRTAVRAGVDSLNEPDLDEVTGFVRRVTDERPRPVLGQPSAGLGLKPMIWVIGALLAGGVAAWLLVRG